LRSNSRADGRLEALGVASGCGLAVGERTLASRDGASDAESRASRSSTATDGTTPRIVDHRPIDVDGAGTRLRRALLGRRLAEKLR
jgi:hypothetical protein